jgi:hypothetical protein
MTEREEVHMDAEMKAPQISGWLDGLGGREKRQNRWLTPERVPQALGHFDLDPCGAPGHVLADRTYLLERGDDGLRDPWVGRVFCNPPYGQGEMEPFLRRMSAHGHGTLLIFATTETVIFHEEVWGKADAILFLKGRIKFINASGVQPKGNSGKPSILAAYGAEDVAALEDAVQSGRLKGIVIYPRLKP